VFSSDLKGEELDAVAYYKDLYSKMDLLEMDRKFTARSVNEGFSGGEKKRNEILQMMMLDPAYCILDETDSGLDIDALKIVAKGVNAMRSPDRGMLLITHYQRLLDYIAPDHVHVMAAGRIVRSGGPELALELEKNGYDVLKDEALATACTPTSRPPCLTTLPPPSTRIPARRSTSTAARATSTFPSATNTTPDAA